MFENHSELLSKLKKQVRELQQKEAAARTQLDLALKKLQKFGVKYKAKLASSVRKIKTKIDAVKSADYAKAAIDLECKLLKQVELKALAVAAAAKKLKTEHAKKLTKSPRAVKKRKVK